MNTNFTKIKELVQKSSITIVEQNKLIKLFAGVNDQDLEPIIKICSEDNSWISKINKNYKAKQVAIADSNIMLWQEIIKEEESMLKEL
jgi:hypothetical protein